jgi:predicted amidophosphoribosyltransferase
MRVCAECGRELEAAYRFCPWCASPQRRKLVEFFRAHPRELGRALRVSRYLTEEPHVRFSVWSAEGVAESAVSLEEAEAERLAAFLAAPAPTRPSAVERLLARLPRG